ncbi:hypothetical protein LGIHADK_02076 [Mannheimia haemolytica]
MFKQLQQVGKAFMLPIAILPAAGLLLGIGGALSNKATVQAYPILDNPTLQGIFQIMASAGSVVFGNLALLLCIGLGIGLAKRDKGVAALAAVVGYLIMTGTISALIPLFPPETKGIDTGVIGSLVMGLITVKLHNKYHNIQLPQILGFFGGSRFVPIVTAFAAIFVGAVFFFDLAGFPTVVGFSRARDCGNGRNRHLFLRFLNAVKRCGRLTPYDLPAVLVHRIGRNRSGKW